MWNIYRNFEIILICSAIMHKRLYMQIQNTLGSTQCWSMLLTLPFHLFSNFNWKRQSAFGKHENSEAERGVCIKMHWYFNEKTHFFPTLRFKFAFIPLWKHKSEFYAEIFKDKHLKERIIEDRTNIILSRNLSCTSVNRELKKTKKEKKKKKGKRMPTPRKTESFWELETSIGNLEPESGNWKVFYMCTQFLTHSWTRAL